MIAQVVVDYSGFEEIGVAVTFFFVLGMLLFGGGIAAFFWGGWWLTNRPGSLSPFTGEEMLIGENLSYTAVRATHDFMESLPQPENLTFDTTKAALCKRSGALFSNVVNNRGIVVLPRDYITKRYKGSFVEWTTLSRAEQERILDKHVSIEAFRTVQGASHSEAFYADVITAVLVGWQRVPLTDLKVLVVQKPKGE